MARRVRDSSPQTKSARFDLAVDLLGKARFSVVVGAQLDDAWARARSDWPDIDQSRNPGDAACVLEVAGQAVMILEQGVDVGTFAHEALHVSTWVLHSRGIPVSYENDESLAYVLQWVVGQVWPLVAEWSPPSTDGDVQPVTS